MPQATSIPILSVPLSRASSSVSNVSSTGVSPHLPTDSPLVTAKPSGYSFPGVSNRQTNTDVSTAIATVEGAGENEQFADLYSLNLAMGSSLIAANKSRLGRRKCLRSPWSIIAALWTRLAPTGHRGLGDSEGSAAAAWSAISTDNGEVGAKIWPLCNWSGILSTAKLPTKIDGAISGTAPVGSSAGQQPDISPSAPAYPKRDTEQMVRTLLVLPIDDS